MFDPTGRSHRQQFPDSSVNGVFQKAADVWKKDVWDFRAFSRTFLELRFSIGNEGKDRKNLTPRLGLELPDVLLPDIRDHPSFDGAMGGVVCDGSCKGEVKTDQVTYDQTTSCTLAWAPA